MREILFRGKRTDNGEWVEGYYSNLGGNSPRILKENIFIGKRGRVLEFENIKVLHETVGQFTGLTDKNGRRIFEGDIVKSPHCIYVIMWDTVKALFYLRDPISKVSSDFYNYFGSDLTVIGNIHDNLEILEGGGDNA